MFPEAWKRPQKISNISKTESTTSPEPDSSVKQSELRPDNKCRTLLKKGINALKWGEGAQNGGKVG